MPPPVVAYWDSVLDSTTLERFRQGLINSSNSDRGQTLLTLFRLTGFAAVPDDFDKVLADRLNVMDATAIVMCRENNLPLQVFNLFNAGDLMRIVQGEDVGTVVSAGP